MRREYIRSWSRLCCVGPTFSQGSTIVLQKPGVWIVPLFWPLWTAERRNWNSRSHLRRQRKFLPIHSRPQNRISTFDVASSKVREIGGAPSDTIPLFGSNGS